MIQEDMKHYTEIHSFLEKVFEMMTVNFPDHTIFFATNDRKTNVIRKVLDQASLCIPEDNEDPYQESFCHLAVDSPENSVVIPDLTKHSFTKEHYFTKRAGGGSFMGAAVLQGNEEALGTLCLISNYSALFTEAQLTLLKGYAYIIAKALEVEQNQMRDSLTGLYLPSALAAIFEKKQETYASWSLLYINLCSTRVFNERYGYETGDLLLQKVAKMLYETFPPGTMFARASQDKFVVMLAFSEDENARKMTEFYVDKLLQHLNDAPCLINGETSYIRMVIGAALYGETLNNFNMMWDKAGQRAIRGNLKGIEGLIFTDNDDQEKMEIQEFTIRNAMQEAGFYDHLALAYQPQIDMQRETIAGVEALIRWHHPVHGFLPPNIWIPLAEQSEVIHSIGLWVLERACLEMKTVNDHLKLSINVSPTQLYDPAFPENVRRIINEVKYPPSYLTFEITENIFMEKNPVILKNLLELKEIGVKLAVDDFGVGYASFHLLHRFPIDILKIDRQLSSNLESISNKKIVGAIIELAYSLDMQCIVEGIETKEQHHYYQTHRVDWGQGYYYYKPMPAAELAALFTYN